MSICVVPVCVCARGHVCICVYVVLVEEGVGSPGAGVTGCWEPPNRNAGDRPGLLVKSTHTLTFIPSSLPIPI